MTLNTASGSDLSIMGNTFIKSAINNAFKTWNYRKFLGRRQRAMDKVERNPDYKNWWG